MTGTEVLYRGIRFPLRFIREFIKKNIDEELYRQFRLDSSRVFNSRTGAIEYKYAWDSVVCHLYAEHNEVFRSMLDAIVEEINNDNAGEA